MTTDEKIALARAGICPVCKQPAPILSEEDITDRLDISDGDDMLDCYRCIIRHLAQLGWDLATFKRMCSILSDEEVKYIIEITTPPPPVYENEALQQFAEFAKQFRKETANEEHDTLTIPTT